MRILCVVNYMLKYSLEKYESPKLNQEEIKNPSRSKPERKF